MKQSLQVAAQVVLLALVVSGLSVVSAENRTEKPNIILILTDDQGYGDLAKHGHPHLSTPHTDRLFDESVRFDNFYVSPSCSPTRAALLTGMHEFSSGVTHTIQPREHLNKNSVTLPQLLKAGGYRTGFIGKWHLGGGAGYTPANRGFDWTSTNQGGPRVHFDPVFIRNGERQQREGFREDIFFDEAMAFIRESKDQPFFCYLATYSPHTPLGAPKDLIAKYKAKGLGEEHAAYLAMIENIDGNVGRLVKFLKDSQLDENTIVIYMNDNGVTHGLDLYNAGMRGCKCTAWEGGSRAMSFWRWPKQWKPQKVDELTAHLDVLPTLCDLAGVKVPSELKHKLTGYSLVPLLESKEPKSWNEKRMLFHHVARWPSGLAASHKYAMCGVRQGDYLLLRSHACDDPECLKYSSQCTTMHRVSAGLKKATYTEENAAFHWGVSPKGRWMLVNTKTDPACKTDLSRQKPELVEELAAAYDQWWDKIYTEMIKAGGDKGEPRKLLRPTVIRQ